MDNKPANENLPLVDEAMKAAARQSMRWYAVVDAAQDPEMVAAATDDGLFIASLYLGEKGAAFREVAPHVTEFRFDGALAEKLIKGWGSARGIFLQSAAGMTELRKHLRRFLLIEDSSGARFRFRFYDPRVLRTFLPTCTIEEADKFFGPVGTYFCEGRMGRTLQSFERAQQGIAQQQVQVRRYRKSRDGKADGPTASLTIMLRTRDSDEPIVNASVKVEGPDTKYAVSRKGGVAHFDQVAMGNYQIMAMDESYRMGTSTVSVEAGGNKVKLVCA
ncbi:MAG: DUF4123 domain-containing protein [Planctomycetota bacterium]|jgi:hypothetical protein